MRFIVLILTLLIFSIERSQCKSVPLDDDVALQDDPNVSAPTVGDAVAAAVATTAKDVANVEPSAKVTVKPEGKTDGVVATTPAAEISKPTVKPAEPEGKGACKTGRIDLAGICLPNPLKLKVVKIGLMN